ncbi:hypothetical protein V1290_004086 [Bradyrhizobium sp. AZCC 1578]
MTSAHTRNAQAPSSLTTSFPRVLHADGPDPERKAKLELYSWLVGQWEMDVTTILEDGSTHAGRGEIHAGWILQGRAIQDVWMIPRLEQRRPGIEQLPGAGNWYGTTLRIYDPNLDAWRILWNDPATPTFSRNRSAAHETEILCRKVRIHEAARCAGPFPKLNRRLFIGRRSGVWTTKTGGRKSIFVRAACERLPACPATTSGAYVRSCAQNQNPPQLLHSATSLWGSALSR